MKTFRPNPALAFLLAGFVTIGSTAFAGSSSSCDKVATDVRTEVEKDPAKVLMVVEDFMVSNETCACEIVKAAILASKANGDLVKQIVLTATNVAPNMSKIIVECASAVAPEHAEDIEASNKSTTQDHSKMAKEVTLQPVGSPDSDSGGGGAFTGTGVYLVQPSAGGIVTTKETHDTPKKKVVVKRIVVRRSPPDTSTPQSPADADCTCPP